jgi:hypothetical protein
MIYDNGPAGQYRLFDNPHCDPDQNEHYQSDNDQRGKLIDSRRIGYERKIGPVSFRKATATPAITPERA